MPRIKADITAEPVPKGAGIYAAFNLHDDTIDRLIEWSEASNLGNKLISPYDYHVTSVYSRQSFPIQVVGPCLLRASFAGFELFGPEKNTLVALLECPLLVKLFNMRLQQGMETDFPEHKPHVTLAKDVTQADLDGLLPLDFPIYLREEVAKPLDEDFSYNDKKTTAEAILASYFQRLTQCRVTSN